MWIRRRFQIIPLLACLAALPSDDRIVESSGFPQSAIYVWQEAWSQAVNEAVHEMADDTDAYWVLAGDLIGDDDAVYFHVNELEFFAFTQGPPVTPVVRMAVSVLEPMDAGRLDDVAGAVLQVTNHWREAAEAAGARVDGLQLDFDCPTGALDQYAALIRRIRTEYHGPLSITALPDWLRAEAFPACIAPCDFYVLQVHSLERPASIDDDIALFDAKRARRYRIQADTFGVPFYIALPTYAYSLYFDRSGAFQGIVAEQSPPLNAADLRVRRIAAAPGEIAPYVRSIPYENLQHCRGLAWFRLPVEGDTHNWKVGTLRRVMSGG